MGERKKFSDMKKESSKKKEYGGAALKN